LRYRESVYEESVMDITMGEIGRVLSLLLGIGCVFLATRPAARQRPHRLIATPRPLTTAASLDESGYAYLRLGALGRNRWDRRDLALGVGADPLAGEPDVMVWPGTSAGPGSR
jgi:hypothetical protein